MGVSRVGSKNRQSLQGRVGRRLILGADMMVWLRTGAGSTAGWTHLMEGHVRHVIEPAWRD
jgi:hypothetical protein